MLDDDTLSFRKWPGTEKVDSNVRELPLRYLSPEGNEQASGPQSGTAADIADRRAHERVPINTELQLRWEERKGVQRQVRARAVDVSKFGLQIVSERAIPGGTIVSVYTAQFAPVGRASVRHCSAKGMDYTIGLYMPDLFMQDL